jgi:hypothetical protein
MDSHHAQRVIAQVEAATEAVRASGCTVDLCAVGRAEGGTIVEVLHCGGCGPLGMFIVHDASCGDVAAVAWNAMTHGQPHGRGI